MIYRENKRWSIFYNVLALAILIIVSAIGLILHMKEAVFLGVLPFLLELFVWGIRYRILVVGFRKAWVSYRLVHSLRSALLEAGIVIPVVKGNDGVMYAKVPSIKIDYKGNEPVVYIENMVGLQRSFDCMDLSSGLLGFAVESKYLSLDRNEWVLELHDFSKSRRLVVNSPSELISDNINELMIDRNLSVPYQHMLVSGRTGSGKSYFVEGLLLQLAMSGCNVISIADPKHADLTVIGRLLHCDVASDRDGIFNQLISFHESMLRRQNVVENQLQYSINKTAADMDLPQHFLVIDEFADLQAQLKLYEKKRRDQIMSALQSVIFKGRQLGYFVIIVMQKTDSTILPTSIRDNLGFKVVLGDNDATTYQTAFGHSSDIPKVNLGRGVGWYVLDGNGITPRILETPTLNFDIQEAFSALGERSLAD